MALITITAPAAYPVTLTEAKAWCRIDSTDTDNNTVLALLIAAMTARAEEITGRAFVERALQLNLQGFAQCIELPWAPLIGVTSIAYTDINDTAQVVTAADYEVDTVRQPGLVRPVFGAAWPSIGNGFNPVRVNYQAGYRPTGSPTDLTDNSYLPAQLRMWIQARIATLFENREQLIVNSQVQIPRDFADGVLDGLIVGTRFF